ncbi:MAG: c-type cytochrome [Saprospiraceae bacterium]|nr:c-type cytochrome [Saprospiraceae bacterium]
MMRFTFFLLLTALLVLSLPAYRSADPATPAELGERLFFDPILSADRTISCASCHKPEYAFADTLPFSLGIRGQHTTRNTPTAMNMGSRPYFFYDGRVATLADQALHPIRNPIEMGLPIPDAVRRLAKHKQYKRWFADIYHRPVDSLALGDALAAFEFTLETADTPNDRWLNGDTAAMTASQRRGRQIFLKKGRCFDCHFSPDFTGDEFRNVGLYTGAAHDDVGRFAVTKDSADLGKFKVPGLRNVAVTAPYMHDGRFRTLREVIDYYDQPINFVKNPVNADSLVQTPLGLTEQEKVDLENYLHALTDDRFQKK